MKKVTKDDFFDSINTITKNPKEDGLRLDYLKVLEAVSRTTYQSMYVIDYYTRSFEFVSEHPLFLCGYSIEEFINLGYDFYIQNTPKEDLELLLYINKIGTDFYGQLSMDERLDLSISYDFHLIQPNGKKVLVNHMFTPLILTKHGEIWKALCVFSLSNRSEAGNIQITKVNSNKIWRYDRQLEKWKEGTKVSLTEREKEILILTAQGYSTKEIGEKLFIQDSTIKFHRSKMYDKMKVNSISEALNFAIANQLI